jgi:hypothetical protein
MATAAEISAVRTALVAAIAAGDFATAKNLAAQATALIATSPSRQKHGDSETEWDASGAWLEPLMALLAAAETAAATAARGSSIRRQPVRYCNVGCAGAGGYY